MKHQHHFKLSRERTVTMNGLEVNERSFPYDVKTAFQSWITL